MKLNATGQLYHHFWGDYWARICLGFQTMCHADAALLSGLLGPGWHRGREHQNVLTWAGGSDDLALCEDRLESLGADREAVSSVAHSIDHGDPFKVSFEVDFHLEPAAGLRSGAIWFCWPGLVQLNLPLPLEKCGTPGIL